MTENKRRKEGRKEGWKEAGKEDRKPEMKVRKGGKEKWEKEGGKGRIGVIGVQCKYNIRHGINGSGLAYYG